MFFNEAQSLNALSSIETTPSGKIISCKDEHPENAPDSIFLTLVGIVMCFKEEQFANVLITLNCVNKVGFNLAVCIQLSSTSMKRRISPEVAVLSIPFALCFNCLALSASMRTLSS